MIEKKRRDRINASLGELRRLVPAAARDPHSGKLEKAEILQLTVEHLRTLRNKGELFVKRRKKKSSSNCIETICIRETHLLFLIITDGHLLTVGTTLNNRATRETIRLKPRKRFTILYALRMINIAID